MEEKTNKEEPIEIQIWRLVKCYTGKYVIAKRQLLPHEIEDFVSIATLTILEHISAYKPERGSLSHFVYNYCRYNEPVWYYECRYLITQNQSLQMRHKRHFKNMKALKKMQQVWFTEPMEYTFSKAKDGENDAESHSYLDLNYEFNAKNDELYSQAEIDCVKNKIKEIIMTDNVSVSVKKMLCWWVDHDFDQKATVKHFNTTRQWVSDRVRRLRKKIKTEDLLRVA